MSDTRGRLGSFWPVVAGAGATPGEVPALVTSFSGGRFPLRLFWGGTLPRFMAAGLGELRVSTLGRVNGRYEDVDGPRDNGLPTPPPGGPGVPTRR